MTIAVDTQDPSTNMGSKEVNELLDKLVLKQLHLLEDKMRCEMNIESSVNNGSYHLAKSRYIMGQNSVNITKLPTENSTEFAATTVCEAVEEDDVKQLQLTENNASNTVNPMNWFGVLLPQNLYKAQTIFQNALNYIVECVNVQLQIDNNIKRIESLRLYKKNNFSS